MIGRLREVALWAGALLGLLSMLVGTAVLFFGFSFLIYRSGTMSPDISTGSLALARTTPAAELEAGDVVSVVAANGERITHRLVSSTLRGDEASLVLKGDANETVDREVYVVREAEREIASMPYAGYVVTVLLSPAGIVAVGCLSGMLLLIGFGSRGDSRGGRSPRSGGRHRSGTERAPRVAGRIATVAVSLVAVSVAAVGVSSTSAFFSDTARLTSGNYTAGSVLPPASIACAAGGGNNSITVSWPHRDTAYDYSIVIRESEGGQVVSTRDLAGSGAVGSLQSLTINRGLSAGFQLLRLTFNYTVEVSSRLRASPTWTSGSVDQPIRETRPLLSGTYRIFCGS